MKRILVILTALIGLGFSANAQAIIDKGTCGDNLTWILTGTDNNLTLTISGTGTMTNYVYYGNRSPWTSHGRNIATVVTNNGVATIGEYAFLFCENLTSVSIPNSVTSIGGSAFMYCRSLTSINIPNSVTSIGGSAFSGCSSLTSINIAEYNRYYSSDNGVLFNKNKTVLIFYPQGKSGDYTIPTSVTEIGKYAFYSCSSLKSVNIPNSVTSIGGSAFYKCSSLTSINIPNSVTEIGEWAFMGCSSLTSVNIPNSVTKIGVQAFMGCSSLTSVNIPNSVTEIGTLAFDGCSSLTSINIAEYNRYYSSDNGVLFNKNKTVLICYPQGKSGDYTIPTSVTEIGKYAFYSCSSLKSVNIPNSVTSIGGSTFYKCSSLTSINIPNSVTEIDKSAFDGCHSLKSINIAEYNRYYSSDNGVLFNKNKTVLICYPQGKSGDYTIPNSVTSIGKEAFAYCNSLASINIPNSVTSIGEDAFMGCSLLNIDIKSLLAENKQKEEVAQKAKIEAAEAEKAQKAIDAKKYEDLAWKYYRMKEMNEADKQADLALAIHGTADMYFIKARVIHGKINWPRKETYNGEYNTEFRNVLSYCNKALSEGNCSEMEFLYFMRGYANNMLRYYEDGRSDFHAVLRLNPNNELANYNIGVAYYNQENYNMALTYFKAAREIGFSNKDDESDNFDMIKKCGEKLK